MLNHFQNIYYQYHFQNIYYQYHILPIPILKQIIRNLILWIIVIIIK